MTRPPPSGSPADADRTWPAPRVLGRSPEPPEDVGAGAAGVVIVGAGHAGVQLAASLREDGYRGPVTLLSRDANLPYQRPPLSKAYMKGGAGATILPLRAAEFYSGQAIDLRLGERVVEIDRAAGRVVLASGDGLAYDHLVLALGARARPFAVPGHDLDGVLGLRDLDDASRIRERLEAAEDVVVIGAGFIGLEVTATAVSLGKRVRVVEIGARPLGRAVSSHISAFYHASHAGSGAELTFGASVAALEGQDGRVSAVILSDGTRLRADLVLVGIGVLPDDDLARAAGLACEAGVVVDPFLLTSDPRISAIGDCASFPSHHAALQLRLESVQNAVDQARCVAKRLTGHPQPFRSLPWFWSDQGPSKLQIAGLSHGCDRWVLRGDPATGAFTVFGFRGEALAVIETVNRPADHMIARQLLSSATPLTPEQAADPDFDLRALVAPRRRGA